MITNTSAWVHTFQLTSNGSAFNLTGKQFSMRISKALGQASVIQITSANSKIAITDAANGKLTVTLSATDMANFTPGTYFYEVGWTNNTAGYTRLFGGKFPVSAAPGA